MILRRSVVMELLLTFFQTGGLAILVMLSCLLSFCDSFHTKFAVEEASKKTAMNEQKVSTLQDELTSLQARHDHSQKMMDEQSQKVSTQLGETIA